MITLIWEEVGKFSNAACATSFIHHSQCTALSGQFYPYLSLQYLKYENNPIRKSRAKRWLDSFTVVKAIALKSTLIDAVG